MKLPAFNRDQAQWDQWKAFYVENAGFTQFETGELVCTSHFGSKSGWGHSVDTGRGLKQIGVTVFQVNDQPEFLRSRMLRDPVTGVTVKRSWLQQAAPMIYDHDAKRVVMIRWFHKSEKASELVPTRFHGRAGVYWPGDGRMPVGGGPVHYSRLTEWTKAQRAEAREIVNTVKAQVRIGLVSEPQYWHYGSRRADLDAVLKTPLVDMDDSFKLTIAKIGVRDGYTSCSADYLEVVDV